MLCAENLTKIYENGSRKITAVAEVNLKIQSGSITAVIGRSGSGKSTLLNMLSGLLKPDEGSVLLNGQDIYRLDDYTLSKLRNEKMGIIPQGRSILNNLNVIDNVCLPYYIYNKDKSCISKASELLERVGIGNLSELYPKSLSGGELKRVAIARALINSPDIVFADEPTSDLDTDNTKAVIKLLREMADSGKAVVLVTHETDTIADADEVWSMSAGVLSRL
jgi:putative ABC transport system ATP-binding protein